MSRLRRALPWIWTAALALAAGALSVVASRSETEAGEMVVGASVLLFAVLLSALGALIGTRRPANGISWIFHVSAFGILVALSSSAIVEAGQPASPTVLDLLAVFGSLTAVQLIFYPLFLLLYVFPTGRFLTRRWRWAGRVGWAVLPLFLLTVLTDPIHPAFTSWAIENPLGFLAPSIFDVASITWFVAFMVVALGSIPAVWIRYRVSTDLERAQLKWLILATVIAALAIFLQALGVEGGFLLGTALFLAIVFPIPLAVTIAINRYRLFEIDRIISRTVSYSVVVGLLVLVFAAGVVWIPSALGLGDEPILVAASTLVVAALFNPLRRRVQHVVDRRFNRSKYHARLIEDQFAARLQESLTSDELAEAWAETVHRHLQPEASGVWLKDI